MTDIRDIYEVVVAYGEHLEHQDITAHSSLKGALDKVRDGVLEHPDAQVEVHDLDRGVTILVYYTEGLD